MFRTQNEIADLFSMLHDGVVTTYRLEGSTLSLEVAIQYLTERINPDYRFFRVTLKGVARPVFETWPKERSGPPRHIERWEEILQPAPDILSADVKNGRIQIILNQPAVECDHCGGTLEVTIERASIYDESGRPYTLEELEELCTEYWEEWSSKR